MDQEPPSSPADGPAVSTLDNITTDEHEVLAILNSFDSHKSTGPDDLPIKFLKLTALLIAKALSHLFNKSLATGTYPNQFKEANVRPIFKNKGSPSDSICYRPISVLSALSKVFEKIVLKNIYSHITHHSLQTDRQSGYRQHHSTKQQLLYLTHNLYKSLDKGHDFTAVYLDISKFLDRIWHSGLLYKCKNDFGITGKLYKWLKSYLQDRKQRFGINDSFSSVKITNAGCPQGSVLGPLLALIYVDNLANKTRHDILFFLPTTHHSSLLIPAT